MLAFDAARREAAGGQRPWHRALIAERAARFHLAHGLDHAGFELLAQARQRVPGLGRDGEGGPARLGLSGPATGTRPDRRCSVGVEEPTGRAAALVTTGTLDLLGILSASQALSSETSVERLHARVVEVLGAMTGATGVHLLLWATTGGTAAAAPEPRRPVTAPATSTRLPISVLRYMQRTGDTARRRRRHR